MAEINNHNRMGFGPSITTYTTGEVNHMARVAKQDQFVEDVHGVRRLVKAGQQVPPGLFDEGTVEYDEVATAQLARPVIDEEASRPSGTAAEPDAGISFESAKALQADAREQGEKAEEPRAARRNRKAEKGE